MDASIPTQALGVEIYTPTHVPINTCVPFTPRDKLPHIVCMFGSYKLHIEMEGIGPFFETSAGLPACCVQPVP